MLKKKYRGLTEAEVSELFTGPHQSQANRFFRVNWISTEQNFPQFVVVTPRKIEKSAVMRNSLRRRIYEMIRLGFSQWTQGYRVAILVKNPALESSAREFRDAFQQLMQKAKLFEKGE